MSVGTIKQTACLYKIRTEEITLRCDQFLDLKKERSLRLKIYVMNQREL
jgi:hypothetical protein